MAMVMAAISSSICLLTTPYLGPWAVSHSKMDDAGVMG